MRQVFHLFLMSRALSCVRADFCRKQCLPGCIISLVMRPNTYLYIVPLGDGVHTVIFNPDKYAGSHPKLVERLFSQQFIVNDGFDERAFLKEERDRFVFAKEYKTTILPTFDCNYNCWYCVQKHEPVELDYAKFDLIIKHIKNYILANGIEDYVLSWFGGEPLTQPQAIEYVSTALLDFCKDQGVDYTSGITTNGALLSEDNIKMLEKCKVNFYQIAIDGDERTHNKNKFDDTNSNSFRLILTNIVNLLENNPEADVVLRLNYTLATLKSKDLVNDITKYIPYVYRKRIKVDLQKVWQVNEQSVSIDLLRKLQEQLTRNGFELVRKHVFSTCYVEKEHYNMFYYNGGVEKCDKRPMDKLRGRLNSDGDIVWDEMLLFPKYDLFDKDCVCSSCRYYPLCYCGCPILREDRIRENKGTIICGHKGNYELFKLRIQDYCWRTIYNKTIVR